MPDSAVPWDVKPRSGYVPNEFVHPAVVANASDVKPGGWADPVRWHPAHTPLATCATFPEPRAA